MTLPIYLIRARLLRQECSKRVQSEALCLFNKKNIEVTGRVGGAEPVPWGWPQFNEVQLGAADY